LGLKILERQKKYFMNLLQAYKFLDTITEGKDAYLDKYKSYVLQHKERVGQFADWLKKNCPDVFEGVDLGHFDTMIKEHDESKFSEEEFVPYARFWYDDSEHYDYDPEYELAWEHHYMNNEHHPEYWDGEDMPYIYILEMLCDWGSFSIAKKDFKELSDYYYNEAKEDDEKNLSEATQEIIEDVLSRIDAVIAREE
jgi:hypothetical protein